MPYLGRTPTPSPIDASDIPDNSIDASKIVDGSIAVADIGANAVGSSELIDNAVTDAKIADATIVNLKSGRKNLLINGGFDVWQRGTSFTSNKYTADRWYQWNSATSAIVTKETNGLHFVAQNSGSSLIEQRIENGSQFAGKTVTASVYIEGTPLNAYMFMYTRTGETGGSWQNTSSTNTLSSGLNTVTWDIPSGSGILILRIACDQTGDVDFTISNAQLELGSVATDFEHRSYGEELALCQRYYQTGNNNVTGNQYGSANCDGTFFLATEMRSVPDYSFSSTNVYHVGWTNSVTTSVSRPRVNGFAIRCVHSGTAGFAVQVESNWTADAEL